MLAALAGHEPAFLLLLKKGANIETRDDYGITSIMRAAWEGHEAAVRLFLKSGANILATDNNGMDIRHWVLGASSLYGCRASNDLVAKIYKKFCQSMHTSLLCPPLTNTRRAVVIMKSTVSFRLSLCSLHAHIELPPGASAGVTEAYKRTLTSAEDQREMVERTLEFSVIHQEDSLEFVLACPYLRQAEFVRLQVVNGGTRLASFSEGDGRSFHKWIGVELDPDAEFVDDVVPISWHEGGDHNTDDEGSDDDTGSV